MVTDMDLEVELWCLILNLLHGSSLKYLFINDHIILSILPKNK